MPSSSPEPRTVTRRLLRLGLASLLALAFPHWSRGDDLADFKTVETAQKTTLKTNAQGSVGLSGYLGVEVKANGAGQLSIANVGENSPAQTAGLKRGDRLRRVDEKAVATEDEFRGALLAHVPGEIVTIEVERDGMPVKKSRPHWWPPADRRSSPNVVR